jgi:hypothetical protein
MGRRQLGIVFADDACINYLREVTDRPTRGLSSDCRVSFPLRLRVGTSVVLILYQGAARFVAGVEDESRADDLRWRFSLKMLTPLGRPLDKSRLQAELKKSQQRPLEEQGKLTDLASKAVLDLVISENPELDGVISSLFGGRDIDLPPDQKAALAEDRDSLATMCAFTGAPDLAPDNGFLTESEIRDISNRESFLPPMRGVRPREDPMVEHDASTFLGWTRRETDRLAVRKFTDGYGRTLEIMNVNRWPTETRLGTDLIYYHQQRDSFVLVQYKRMVPEGSLWRCRVDDHFRDQLDVMRGLDDDCLKKGIGHDYRMVPTPSFIKICRLDSLEVESTSMISGMYMPREQVERYVARPEAPKHIAPETFRDYLTSSMFAQLVALGCVGTAGAASIYIEQEIERSLQQGKAVNIGVFSDRTGRRPSRGTSGKKPSLPRHDTPLARHGEQEPLF